MQLISAIATAQGRGGVAVVRMSGEGALGVAKKMFSRKGEFTPNRMYAGEIDGGRLRDFGYCVYFRAPRSFTGEDCVEFHCHGGTELARAVLEQTVALGARLAERGEFTRRAFLNGKLSLSAAEGLADMINAQSAAQARAGYTLYGEALTRACAPHRAALLECLAGIDAALDYPEEDLARETAFDVAEKLRGVRDGLAALAGQYRAGRKIKAGVNVAICGKPNAGKSSLLNALLGYERAIVSDVAGTTRDLVEGTLELGGVLFRFTDTAGMRESADAIEREGVRRAENAMKAADVVVWLKEEEAPPAAEVPLILVGAKCDVVRREGCDVLVSARTGEGLEALKRLVYERGFGAENDGAYLLEARHYEALAESAAAAARAVRAAESGLVPELVAEEVRAAWSALGTVSGETASEEIVTEIFSKFCVGK